MEKYEKRKKIGKCVRHNEEVKMSSLIRQHITLSMLNKPQLQSTLKLPSHYDWLQIKQPQNTTNCYPN